MAMSYGHNTIIWVTASLIHPPFFYKEKKKKLDTQKRHRIGSVHISIRIT